MSKTMKFKLSLLALVISPMAMAGGTYATQYTFPALSGASSTGAYPEWELVKKTGTTDLYGVAPKGGTLGGGTLYKMSGGVVTVVRNFGVSGDIKGSRPDGPVLNHSGSLYGVTAIGGANNTGVLYRWNPTSGFKTIHSFGSGTAGASPSGQLLLANDGNVYGVTKAGGSCGLGTVYKYVVSTGAVTTLHSFCGQEGTSPITGVIQASDGNLYGTAYTGGANGGGSLYKLTLAGAFTRLYSFGATASAPKFPSRLTQGRDGLLYGMSWGGGLMDVGTIFTSTLAGSVSVRAQMGAQSNTSLQNPSRNAALLEKFTGVFYGVSYSNTGSVFQFRASTKAVSVIHSSGTWVPGFPLAGLTVGADGNLWGNTTDGEVGYGTIYNIQNLVANP
jgi:uncharacterized repeat protein (TIGR03803 family)